MNATLASEPKICNLQLYPDSLFNFLHFFPAHKNFCQTLKKIPLYSKHNNKWHYVLVLPRYDVQKYVLATMTHLKMHIMWGTYVCMIQLISTSCNVVKSEKYTSTVFCLFT